MPYNPDELKDISDDKTGEDPTLLAATPTPDAVNPDAPQYHPVIDKNEHILVRKDGSVLDWKNYKFEITFNDGTRQEFVFTAKDDGDAQKKVRNRMAQTSNQEGTFRLSLLDTPKEVFGGDLSGDGKIVDSNEKKKSEKAEKADKPEKADKADKTEEPKKKA